MKKTLNFSDILIRLKSIFNVKTNPELSKHIKIDAPKLNNWSSRNTIPTQELYNISSYYSLNLHWLLTGQGSIYFDNQSSVNNTIGDDSNGNIQSGGNNTGDVNQSSIDNNLDKDIVDLFVSSYKFSEKKGKLDKFEIYLANANSYILQNE